MGGAIAFRTGRVGRPSKYDIQNVEQIAALRAITSSTQAQFPTPSTPAPTMQVQPAPAVTSFSRTDSITSGTVSSTRNGLLETGVTEESNIYQKYITRFAASQLCGYSHCTYQYKEHYHCTDSECNFQRFTSKQDVTRHYNMHRKRENSLRHGFMRFAPLEDCGLYYQGCHLNGKSTHYHCMQVGCCKVYTSTSDVMTHENFHRKHAALISDGFQRFRAAEDCGQMECAFRAQKTTHFHCRRPSCMYTFKNKCDIEKHKSYHIKDDAYARDGFKKFYKYESCAFPGCAYSRASNHFHCIRPGCAFAFTSTGQMGSHKRKHLRRGSRGVLSANDEPTTDGSASSPSASTSVTSTILPTQSLPPAAVPATPAIASSLMARLVSPTGVQPSFEQDSESESSFQIQQMKPEVVENDVTQARSLDLSLKHSGDAGRNHLGSPEIKQTFPLVIANNNNQSEEPSHSSSPFWETLVRRVGAGEPCESRCDFHAAEEHFHCKVNACGAAFLSADRAAHHARFHCMQKDQSSSSSTSPETTATSTLASVSMAAFPTSTVPPVAPEGKPECTAGFCHVDENSACLVGCHLAPQAHYHCRNSACLYACRALPRPHSLRHAPSTISPEARPPRDHLSFSFHRKQQPCLRPGCKYGGICSHFHCERTGCNFSFLLKQQMASHARKHLRRDLAESAASPSDATAQVGPSSAQPIVTQRAAPPRRRVWVLEDLSSAPFGKKRRTGPRCLLGATPTTTVDLPGTITTLAGTGSTTRLSGYNMNSTVNNNASSKHVSEGLLSVGNGVMSLGNTVIPVAAKMISSGGTIMPISTTLMSPGSTIMPLSTRVMSSGSAVMPLSTGVMSSGSAVMPLSTGVMSSGSAVMPLSTGVMSSGSAVMPLGTGMASTGSTVMQLTNSVMSSGGAIMPLGNSVMSSGNAVISLNAGMMPPGSVVMSLGAGVMSLGSMAVSSIPGGNDLSVHGDDRSQSNVFVTLENGMLLQNSGISHAANMAKVPGVIAQQPEATATQLPGSRSSHPNFPGMTPPMRDGGAQPQQIFSGGLQEKQSASLPQQAESQVKVPSSSEKSQLQPKQPYSLQQTEPQSKTFIFPQQQMELQPDLPPSSTQRLQVQSTTPPRPQHQGELKPLLMPSLINTELQQMQSSPPQQVELQPIFLQQSKQQTELQPKLLSSPLQHIERQPNISMPFHQQPDRTQTQATGQHGHHQIQLTHKQHEQPESHSQQLQLKNPFNLAVPCLQRQSHEHLQVQQSLQPQQQPQAKLSLQQKSQALQFQVQGMQQSQLQLQLQQQLGQQIKLQTQPLHLLQVEAEQFTQLPKEGQKQTPQVLISTHPAQTQNDNAAQLQINSQPQHHSPLLNINNQLHHLQQQDHQIRLLQQQHQHQQQQQTMQLQTIKLMDSGDLKVVQQSPDTPVQVQLLSLKQPQLHQQQPQHSFLQLQQQLHQTTKLQPQQQPPQLPALLAGFRRFEAAEDCADSGCALAHRGTHYHCARADCGYRFAGRTHMFKHAQHHQRVDNLVLDDFRRFKAPACCPQASCPFSGSTHFHCLRCNFSCTDSTKVSSHRKQHRKRATMAAAGFEAFPSGTDCERGSSCRYRLRSAHAHCAAPGCGRAAVGTAQMQAHARKHAAAGARSSPQTELVAGMRVAMELGERRLAGLILDESKDANRHGQELIAGPKQESWMKMGERIGFGKRWGIGFESELKVERKEVGETPEAIRTVSNMDVDDQCSELDCSRRSGSDSEDERQNREVRNAPGLTMSQVRNALEPRGDENDANSDSQTDAMNADCSDAVHSSDTFSDDPMNGPVGGPAAVVEKTNSLT
uniref:zinc finger protein castor homolog 1-like n=1 Tax=Myxine glutinosa TaxID=7769 RepID=UPI00358FDA03